MEQREQPGLFHFKILPYLEWVKLGKVQDSHEQKVLNAAVMCVGWILAAEPENDADWKSPPIQPQSRASLEHFAHGFAQLCLEYL